MNSVITNSLVPAIFICYYRVSLCTKMANFTSKSVRYNPRVFIKNRARYNRVSLLAVFLWIKIEKSSMYVDWTWKNQQPKKCNKIALDHYFNKNIVDSIGLDNLSIISCSNLLYLIQLRVIYCSIGIWMTNTRSFSDWFRNWSRWYWQAWKKQENSSR